MDLNKLFNFDEPFDVNLIDHICYSAFCNPNHSDFQLANNVLIEFKKHPQSWTRVDAILEHSQRPETKHYALTILSDLVKYRWNIIPQEQREEIKLYIITFAFKLSQDDETRLSQRIVLDAANSVIVDIAKQEWPQKWPNFVGDIVESCQTSESICENNLKILLLLKEEVFDFSRSSLLTEKIEELQKTLSNDFSKIYQLCEYILSNTNKESLIDAALKTFCGYIRWIPHEYIFQTKLIDNILSSFFPNPAFRDTCMQILIELASLKTPESEMISHYYRSIFSLSMDVISSTISSTPRQQPSDIYMTSEDGKFYIQSLTIYLTTLFQNHIKSLESDEVSNVLLQAHAYLVNISTIKDREIFKICQEYWHWLAKGLYDEAPVSQRLIGGLSTFVTARRAFYEPIICEVRMIIIDNMAKPEEIIITEDENGNIIRERAKDTEEINLYKCMKSTLVYLTHLNHKETQGYMLKRLDDHLKGIETNVRDLNPLCWAIGSIAGALANNQESAFLVTTIRELLALTDYKRDKDSKAIVASNIMYIVGQYPRFLKKNWDFLKAVVKKLFEFMHETYEGVQDMSCDSFLKIAVNCKKCFIKVQPKEPRPFIEVIIENIPNTISDLDDNQVHTFFEALGEIVSAHPNHEEREKLAVRMMEVLNINWQEIMHLANIDVNNLMETSNLRKISSILISNIRACQKLGSSFTKQIAFLYLDMLNVYKLCSETISQIILHKGPNAAKTIHVRAMRTVKQKTLVLIETFVSTSSNIEPIIKDFLPPLLMPVLEDYRQGISESRDPEVLSLMAQIVTKCHKHIVNEIPVIFDHLFQCTLDMIVQNFEDYPDHRIQFFKLIRAVNKYCFDAILMMSESNFKLIVDSIVWAFKHTMRNVSETGLLVLYDLLENVVEKNVIDSFAVNYFIPLISDIFYVLTDGLHKNDVHLHTRVLQKFFYLAKSGKITKPLWEGHDIQMPPNADNVTFIKLYLSDILVKAFPNQTTSTIDKFLTNLFETSDNTGKFKDAVRDFLIIIKVFSEPEMNESEQQYYNQVQMLQQ